MPSLLFSFTVRISCFTAIGSAAACRRFSASHNRPKKVRATALGVAHPTVFQGAGFRGFRRQSRKQLWVEHVFFRFGTRELQELVKAEEFAAEGAAVGGPLGFAGVERQRGAGGGEFRIEVIEIVENEGFADHGELGRAEFVLAVMADKKMLDDGLQVRGETFDGVHSFRNGFEFHHDVAEELAFDGVADGAFVAEFVELADVMQNRGGEEKINVELGVMRGGLPGKAAQADDVLEQAAEISVMHYFCRGSAFVFRGDSGIRNDRGDEIVQPGVGDGSGEFLELREELIDIFFGVREKVGEVDLFGLGEPKLLKRKLRPVAVDFDARVHLDEVVAIDVFHHDVELVPHAGFDGAAAVAKLEPQIGLALASVANLFFVNEEKSSNGLFRVEIGDEGRLHEEDAEPERLPKSRNFLRLFLLLVTWGVALTS